MTPIKMRWFVNLQSFGYDEPMDPRGKVALITGGARIGAHVAQSLSGHGCRVALTWRHSKEAAHLTLKDIEEAGGEAAMFRADLTNAQTIPSLVKNVAQRFGRLDIIVNMASVYEPAHFLSSSDRRWNRSLDTEILSSYRLAKAPAPVMKKQGDGRIINLCDWTAASARPRYKNLAPYYVSKCGVLGLTQVMALELAPQILVNAIAPGPILPPSRLTKAEDKEVKKATPLGRWGGPQEIAKAVLFLVETDFITGECIRVDGGRHLF